MNGELELRAKIEELERELATSDAWSKKTKVWAESIAQGAELGATRDFLALAAARERITALELELEASRTGAACRQPWNEPEGVPALQARAALQDALHHVQRDGEMGLARRAALHAATLIGGAL